ncbi:hypothetical protein SZ55_3615 [Pseudomonas sp. FeS53a]|nr:hypothetical protein SZ55_3615 [Pseudomonas sp. FeS53a]
MAERGCGHGGLVSWRFGTAAVRSGTPEVTAWMFPGRGGLQRHAAFVQRLAPVGMPGAGDWPAHLPASVYPERAAQWRAAVPARKWDFR